MVILINNGKVTADNMGGKTKTSFTSDSQPAKRTPRGKSARTKMIEALERAGKTEDGFYDELLARAISSDDTMMFKEVLLRISPIPKAVAPIFKFDLPREAKPHVKADYVLTAMANGEIPSDIGNICIQAIKAMIDIEEYTDLKERIEKLEGALDGGA
jgi:hypothetical protein